MSLENDDDNTGFDFDSGVTDIADSLGIGGADDQEESAGEGDSQLSDAGDQEGGGKEGEEGGQKDQNTDAEQQQEVTAKAPPASWAKEKHEDWAKIPPSAQEYIELREKQMLDGIEQYKQGHQYGTALAQALEPYRQDIAASGVDDIGAVRALFDHHRALTTGTIEQRQQALLQIGIASGIIPKDGQTQADLERQAYEQQLRQYQNLEHQRQQQYIAQQQQQIAQAVEAFAADPSHEYFNEVADEIIGLLQAGHDLQSAYDKAVWANPVTRAKEIAKEQQKTAAARAEQQRKEAEAAKKAASVNMRSAQRQGRASDPIGSWDDTMQETLQSIKNR